MRPFIRLCVLFVIGVANVATAQLVLPPFVVSGGHQNDPLVHDGFLDATLYGADPTGTSDSTAAIQSAMNDARDYALATYLPAGTYVISDTLLGWEKLGDPGCTTTTEDYGANMPNEPFLNQASQAPSLVGPPNGARAVLQLASAAAGFDDPQNPKPALHMVNLYPDGGIAGYEGQNLPTSVGAFDCLFNAVVRDVDLTLGAGNPGAIGVQFYSAQMSYMENVHVDATGAYAGFQGAPATSDWVNLSVTGGQYGILMDTACGSNSLAGISLSDQTTAGLSMIACGSTTLSGFDIQETTAQPIQVAWVYSGGGQTVSAALIDGTLAQGNGSGPAIGNPDGMNLFVSNVYVQGASALVQSGGNPAIAGSGATDLITQYSYTDTSTEVDTVNGTTDPVTGYNLVNGNVGQNEIPAVQLGVGSPPSDLLLRHLPGPLPWVGDPGVVDATTLGADPTGAADSTSAIQAAINAGAEVFLPRGDYQISGTITLSPGTRLFGVPGQRTDLYAPNWLPNATYLPFIQAANSSSGDTYLGDVGFHMPDTWSPATSGYDQSYLGALDWQAGRSSVVNQIGINLDYFNGTDITSAARDLIHIEQGGGGKWYGVQSALLSGACRMQNADFLFLFVDGSQAPLTLYGPNFEHADSATFVGIANGASNVRVLAPKTECAGGWASIDDSQNVMVTSINGDWVDRSSPAGFQVTDSSKVELAVLGWYYYAWSGASMVAEANAGGPNVSTPDGDACSLFQEGTFDESPFPHCGDGVCDGAETSANCPADCGGSGSTTGGGSTGGSGSGGATSGGSTGSTIGSSTGGAGASWTACRVTSGAPDWSTVPGFFMPYTDAVIQSNAPFAPQSNAQLSATVQAAWDATNLYVQVRVTQPSVLDDPAVPVFYSDAVELYLDGTDSRTGSYDAGDEQLTVTAGDRASPDGGYGYSATRTDAGYLVDFTVPFATLGSNPGALGFDIAVDDNPDGGATRASQLLWSGDGGAYEDPQQFGTLLLGSSVCTLAVDAGVDAGAAPDGGPTAAPDAGPAASPDGGRIGSSDGGGPASASGGCGCGAGSDPMALAPFAFFLFALYRRKSARTG